MKVKTWFHI